MPGILIVDDHPIIRTCIRSLLEAHELHVCAEASDGKMAIEKATEHQPDIIVLDIMMPVMDGIQAAQELRRILPTTKIVFLTMYESTIFEAQVRSWAHGFVTKGAAGRQLVPTLEAMLAEPHVKYPWQQLVQDAFSAQPDMLVAKINTAERTIAIRLKEENQTDSDERLALNEALRVLEQLLAEIVCSEDHNRKKYSAA